MRKMITGLCFSLTLLLSVSAHADQAAPTAGTTTAPAPAPAPPPPAQPSPPAINVTATTTYDPEVAKGCSIAIHAAKAPSAIFTLGAIALIPLLLRRRRLT